MENMQVNIVDRLVDVSWDRGQQEVSRKVLSLGRNSLNKKIKIHVVRDENNRVVRIKVKEE